MQLMLSCGRVMYFLCLMLAVSACSDLDNRSGNRGWRRRIFDASIPTENPPVIVIPDGGVPPPQDSGTPPAQDSGSGGGGIVNPVIDGGPLTTPRMPCEPQPLATSGNFQVDCVNRVNQMRACQNLPPLARWTDGESCANQQAQADNMSRMAHSGFSGRICTPSGYAQNECPGWGGWTGQSDVIEGCLQMMWDEWFTPGQKGHYQNMSSTQYRRVACGIFQGTSVQNFSP